MKILFLSILAIAFAFPVGSNGNVPPLKDQLQNTLDVEKFTLPNGLTVIFHKDESIPMVSYHQWFRVGSSHEKKGRTGLAHFFEHLMFKGTKNYPSEFYETFITGNGGYNNAFTTRDYTGYFTLMPSDKLEEIIKIEADRMANLNFDSTQIQSEREVVKEERRYRYDNDPDGTLYLLTNETIFQQGPYSWPVIGSMADLNAAKLQEFREFYKTYYSPNNAVIVLVGNFNLRKAREWIESAYGPLVKQDLPTLEVPNIPVQKSPRYAERKMNVQAPKLSLAYRTVSTHHKDEYALQALASLLGGGPSSRLYKTLVRQKQYVTNVGADQNSDNLDGSFTFSFDLRPGVRVDQVVQEVNRAIRKVQKDLAREDELTKVKNEALLGYTSALKSMGGKARLLAYSEIVYLDPKKFLDDLDHYATVNREDIRRVAKQYLHPQSRSTIVILPK